MLYYFVFIKLQSTDLFFKKYRNNIKSLYCRLISGTVRYSNKKFIN